MSEFAIRNRLLLAKVEASEGVEESPVVGSDAIKVEDPGWSPQFTREETNEATGSLDKPASVAGRVFGQASGAVPLKGAVTAGTAPEYGTLLQGMGFAETLLAADESATAQAGSNSTITLAATANAADDFYNGMVLERTGGAGAGEADVVVTDYNGTTKIANVTPDFVTAADVTTVYNFPANAQYVPASASIKSLTMFFYDKPTTGSSARLRKLIGARGTGNLTLPIGGVGRFSHTFSGIIPANPTDVTTPGAATFDDARPKVLVNMDAVLGGTAFKLQTCSINIGGTVEMPPDPAAVNGYDVARIIDRSISGSINPLQELLTVRDIFKDTVDGNTVALWMRWGSVVGNRISMLLPKLTYVDAKPGAVGGFVAEDVNFEARTPDGGVYVVAY